MKESNIEISTSHFITLVKDHDSGFLFEPGDVDGLRRIFENILANPDMLKEMHCNARHCVKQYAVDIHMKKLILNYEEVIRLNRMQRG